MFVITAAAIKTNKILTDCNFTLLCMLTFLSTVKNVLKNDVNNVLNFFYHFQFYSTQVRILSQIIFHFMMGYCINCVHIFFNIYVPLIILFFNIRKYIRQNIFTSNNIIHEIKKKLENILMLCTLLRNS